MLQEELIDLVRTKYPPPRFFIEPLTTTSHYNVIRIIDTVGETQPLVAKGIFHIEGNDDLGPEQMDRAFQTEIDILSRLPAWWRHGIINTFRNSRVRVIVTPEHQTQSWLQYQTSVASDRAIAYALEKQLRWLGENGIAHRDLELKNVLLTTCGPIIIDFEKSKVIGYTDSAATATDWDKLIDSLHELENTRRIGDFLAERRPDGRRKSVGGLRNRRLRSMRSRRLRSKRSGRRLRLRSKRSGRQAN